MTGSSAPESTPLRVMVVDDSAIVRGLIVRMLKADPRIEVTASCSNGQMAVAHAARHPLDVIILDIEMPIMDGIDKLDIEFLQPPPRGRVLRAF